MEVFFVSLYCAAMKKTNLIALVILFFAVTIGVVWLGRSLLIHIYDEREVMDSGVDSEPGFEEAEKLLFDYAGAFDRVESVVIGSPDRGIERKRSSEPL